MNKKPLTDDIRDRYNTLSSKVETVRDLAIKGKLEAIPKLVSINNEMQVFIEYLIKENYER